MVSSTSCSHSRFPLAVENSVDGTASCLVAVTMGTKFSMLQSIALLHLDNLEVSPVGLE